MSVPLPPSPDHRADATRTFANGLAKGVAGHPPGIQPERHAMEITERRRNSPGPIVLPDSETKEPEQRC